MEIQELYRIFLQHPSVQTDSRKIQAGDIFFALKGPSFNGNLFAGQAIADGAAYAIVDEYSGPPNDRIIVTEDCLATLQQLAGYHRLQFNIPFIAITGSNGKTTTKELVHEVLSARYITYTTEGNLNNHIGVPLTLLKIKPDAQMAIVEMGANHQREIASYCEYARPTHGLITNAGKAHLEGFGGVEGIRKGKGELFDFLRMHNGTAFIMKDYDYLSDMSRGINEVITYGTKDAGITGEVAGSASLLEVKITGGTDPMLIRTQLVGDYNLPNVLAAVALGKYFDVSPEKIRLALENYAPSNSRSQLVRSGTNNIILDAYNANPSSMKAAIENFASMQGNSKVLMLGGMRELGEESNAEHQALVNLIQQYNWKEVVLVGGDFKNIQQPYQYFDNSEQARDWYRQQQFQDTQVLIKGSRGIQMEKVLQ